jgi:hypothetical protein
MNSSDTRRRVLLSAATASVLLCAGCFTGPKYDYTRQVDSANIVGAAVSLQGIDNGNCGVVLGKIDGMATNFTVSEAGYYSALSHIFNIPDRLYLAPGKHSLDLAISDSDEYYGNVGHGETGLVGTDSASATPTINVDLLASHVYRIGANWKGSVINITLWDETDGAVKRKSAATWTVSSNGAYTEATPPSGGHR